MYFHQKLSEHENEANSNKNDVVLMSLLTLNIVLVFLLDFKRANNDWVATNLEYDSAGTETILKIYAHSKSDDSQEMFKKSILINAEDSQENIND